MSGIELVASIVGIFFAVGVVVGVLAVIALPRIRYYRRGNRYMNGGGWQEPAATGDDEEPPRWPGH